MKKLDRALTFIAKLFKYQSKKKVSLDLAYEKYKSDHNLAKEATININNFKEWMDKSNIYISKDNFFKTTIKKGITHEK